MKFKSKEGALRLAAALQVRRISLGMTLMEAGLRVKIDCSQLSRFENGKFMTCSKNLHNYANFLQINDIEQYLREASLGERFDQFAAMSSRHRKAAEELLRALEGLG